MYELRILRFTKIVALVMLSTIAFSWVVLYLSARYERRKAEHLIADLRVFPFATAGFAEVRDFALQHGGGVAGGGPSQTPPFTCTAQNCRFDIWLGRPFSRPPTNQWLRQPLYATLPYLGLRPWVVYADFEVRGGVLMRSRTQIGQLKRGALGGYMGLLTIEYSILTERTTTPYFRQTGRSDDYAVVKPHVTGPPTEAYQAWVLQAPDAPMTRVFDTDLRCLTTIIHGCSGLSDLAPSAWQHYQASFVRP
jgi:hypothetical protein